jgi:hypothetical protein
MLTQKGESPEKKKTQREQQQQRIRPKSLRDTKKFETSGLFLFSELRTFWPTVSGLLPPNKNVLTVSLFTLISVHRLSLSLFRE